jgi:small subunit ribosomal protein S8
MLRCVNTAFVVYALGSWHIRAKFPGLGRLVGKNYQARRFTHMAMSDPIADMLTRIRNANSARRNTVDVPASSVKEAITKILVSEGYVKGYQIVGDDVKRNIRITLKYGRDKNEKVISGIKRISKPGLRVYAGSAEIPRVLNGLGTAIVSTNQGIVTDKEARRAGVGGEIIAFVW